MRLIVDTHILLWAISDGAKMPPRARDYLLDPETQAFVSVVSLWEIAIKYRLARGRPTDMPIGAARAAALAEESGFGLLPVTPEHAIAVGDLPRGNHADPFDRMLVAQAVSEPMYLLTSDRKLAGYGAHVMLV